MDNEDVNRLGEEKEKRRLEMESQHLTSIFPEEVWRLIFDNLKDSTTDLESLNNASLFFREVLSPQKVYFLFPNVWEVLAEKYDDNYRSDAAYNEIVPRTLRKKYVRELPDVSNVNKVRCKSCKQMRRVWWYSGILKLRLVCRTWSTAIDARFQRYSQRTRYWINEERDTGFTLGVHGMDRFCEFTDNTNHVTFQLHFRETHESEDVVRSPFLTRAVEVTYSGTTSNPHRIDEYQRFMEISDFLEKYGRHIWHCELTPKRDYSEQLTAYREVSILLCSMPNLKILEMNGPVWHTEIPIPMNMIQLPVLRNLEFVLLNCVHPPIFDAFLRRNPHVSMVNILVIRDFENYDGIFRGVVPLRNLNKLSVQIFKPQLFRILESVPPKIWPLTHLVLSLGRLPGSTLLLPRICNMLNEKWADTLTNLVIDVSRIRDDPDNPLPDLQLCARDAESFQEDLKNVKLQLPRLRYLELITSGDIYCLDFLLGLKESLEVLEVTVTGCREKKAFERQATEAEKEGKLKFLSVYNRLLLETNVFELFTVLKKVKLRLIGEIDFDFKDFFAVVAKK